MERVVAIVLMMAAVEVMAAAAMAVEKALWRGLWRWWRRWRHQKGRRRRQ